MTILCPGDFIVVGETAEGHQFKPSDWAERLGGSLSSLRNRRVVYSPLLMPICYEGIRCLRVAAELEMEYPAIYKEVVEFAQNNHLKVVCDVQVEEIQFFNSLAKEWWDPAGPQAMLHKINPLRVRWISRTVNLKGLKVLDVGCGAGILSEALAEAGADVTGIDLGAELIEVASNRGKGIDYQCIELAEFAEKHAEAFDCVTCLEMLEHVEDFDVILQEIAKAVKPGGYVFLSTLDRTPRSFLEAIVGAEYLLKLVPKGTHHYGQFIRPDELCEGMRNAGLEPISMTGLRYHPLLKTFSLVPKPQTNYWVVGQKAVSDSV